MTGVSGDDQMLGQCGVIAFVEPKYDHMLQSQRLTPQSQPAFPGKDKKRMLVASLNAQMTCEQG